MEPKPAFLGPHVASAFQEASVIEAYPYRAPYPESLFQKLAELLTGSSRAVLDVGTGPGDVARRLAPYVERVDAVDWSAGMLALAQQLPGGDDQRIRWIQGRIEEVALDPPYGLITAGESLHWMDWDVVLPRFATLLEPGAFLAILTRAPHEIAWREPLTAGLSPLLRHPRLAPLRSGSGTGVARPLPQSGQVGERASSLRAAGRGLHRGAALDEWLLRASVWTLPPSARSTKNFALSSCHMPTRIASSTCGSWEPSSGERR